jgi:four helix bundle protein
MKVEDLEIYKLARENSILIYHVSVEHLPKFEMYETGSQIRRAAVSVRANIVEGYWRRSSKKEFLRFLRYAHSSNHEVIEHLKLLWDVKSLQDEKLYFKTLEQLEKTGKMIFSFMKAVEKGHKE